MLGGGGGGRKASCAALGPEGSMINDLSKQAIRRQSKTMRRPSRMLLPNKRRSLLGGGALAPPGGGSGGGGGDDDAASAFVTGKARVNSVLWRGAMLDSSARGPVLRRAPSLRRATAHTVGTYRTSLGHE